MENLTIAQRQEIYEHLLTLGTPGLLAALIAERSEETLTNLQESYFSSLTIDNIVCSGFIWEHTEEEHEFWEQISLCLDDLEKGEYTLNEDGVWVLPEVVETTDDYHILKLDPEYRIPSQTIPEVQPLDYEIGDVVKSSTGEILIAIGNNSNYIKEEPELTFWQKVKFYAGRLFYKV